MKFIIMKKLSLLRFISEKENLSLKEQTERD